MQNEFSKSFRRVCLLLFILPITVWMKAQKTITFYADISEATLEGWMGHIWVGFHDGEKEEIIGFYPGGLSNDGGRQADVSYTFPVSDGQFFEATQIVEYFRESVYVIGVSDCRRLAQRIAHTMGLKVPVVGMKSPAEWLGELIDDN